MLQWDYKFVQMKQQEFTPDNEERVINTQKTDGWKFVAWNSIGAENVYLYFKRPK